MERLKALIAARRTSTKAGAAGLVPFIVYLPFYEQVNEYIVQACEAEEGPTLFLVGAGVLWLTMFFTARKSKTPDNPGVL